MSISPGIATPAAPVSAVAALEQSLSWSQATAEQKLVLKRIAIQRDRLLLRQLQRQQVQSQRAQATTVPLDAPMVERVLTFARLHPVATAALVSGALLVGPRKLVAWGAAAWPLLAKFMR